MRKLTVCMTVCAMLAGISITAHAAEPAVRIGVPVWVGWMPWWVAKEKGLFKKNGVNVKLSNFAVQGDAVQALAGGSLDLASVATNDILSVNATGPKASVVLLHDTYSSTVDIVYQFLPVLIANGYHMVTVSHLLGDRAPGTSYGGRENGPPVNDIHDIPPAQIPALPATPSPKPAPNLPITDIAGQNPGGPQ